MPYTPSYTKDDFETIVTDGIGVAGAEFVSWIDLLILLLILGFVVGIFWKLGNLFR